MAILLVISLLAVLGRAGLLQSWSGDHSETGNFLVESCSQTVSFGADQWICEGQFISDQALLEESANLYTSAGAYGSQQPYVGQRFEVFHRNGDDRAVFPVDLKLNELSRLYLSLLPRLLLLIGSVIWLAGWFLTKDLDVDDFVARDSIAFPQRFGWRSVGVTWIAVGLAVSVLNYVVVTRLVGSLGTF